MKLLSHLFNLPFKIIFINPFLYLSWKTAENLVEEKGIKMEFEEVEPDEDPEMAKNPSIKAFFVQNTTSKENKNPKSSRCKLVKDRNIESTRVRSFFK